MNTNMQRQNRIDYLVTGNPEEVRDLIEAYGYSPPKNIGHLIRFTKQLVKAQGRPFLRELLRLHPERALILRDYREKLVKAEDAQEDNFCGVCGHSSFDPIPNIPISDMSTEDLRAWRDELLAEAEEFRDPALERLITTADRALEARKGNKGKAPTGGSNGQEPAEKKKGRKRGQGDRQAGACAHHCLRCRNCDC
ncbi:MAG: hypothetical protein AAGB22_05000 [Bacteroidota bacterium]